jgi:hypothetical protein
VPGRKFCTSKSVLTIKRCMISTASGRFKLSASERLPRLVDTNIVGNSLEVLIACRLWRAMSPAIGSTLITSAPWSARNIVASGPETTLVRSSTLIPASGLGIIAPLCDPTACALRHIYGEAFDGWLAH